MTSTGLYNKFSKNCSRSLTHLYSTSFSIGIRLFEKKFRQPIYALYGLVRVADEIVDSFHGYDKQRLLQEFKEDTFRAITDGISVNPILQSFQQMVSEYHIPLDLIHSFFESMEMDLCASTFTREEYQKYIYGSAEVIGLICLYIFVKDDKREYQHLEQYARMLGSAFQKVNFLRDLKADYKERNRIYFPGLDINQFENHIKKEIETEIEAEFAQALKGIQLLPKGVKLGVYVAYWYYLQLFNKIKSSDASEILAKRFRINDLSKLFILIKSWMSIQLRRI